MKKRITLALLVTVSAISAQTRFGVAELSHLVRTERIQSVSELLKKLPKQFRSQWVPVFGSGSRQKDTRIILRGKDSKTTITFSLESNREGFGSVEIRSFDPKSKLHEFADYVFEKPHKKNLREGPRTVRVRFGKLDFKDGVHETRDAIHKKIGEARSCHTCHNGGTSRFDLRRLVPKLSRIQEKKRFEEFARRFLGGDPRLEILAKDEQVKKALKAKDAKALERIFSERAKKLHDELAMNNAQAIATQVVSALKKMPENAIGMYALLKGCDLDGLFTRQAWNQRAAYYKSVFGYPSSLKKKLSAQVWDKRIKNPPAKQVVKLLIDHHIKDKRDYETEYLLEDYKGPFKITDKSANLDLLAKLSFFWDGAYQELSEREPTFKSNLTVAQWSMTAHHQPFWFGESFPKYREALTNRIGEMIESVFRYPSGTAKTMSCERLSRLSRISFAARARGSRAPKSRSASPGRRNENHR